MSPGARVVNFLVMVFGNACYSHVNFMDRLSARLQLCEVSALDKSDVIIAFVVVVSRAGTDIEAALQKIPQMSRPVVLVVLHHTFDPYFVAPDSGLSVNRSDVFTVDCLFHEDQRLLRCLRNDEALKAVADHLISKGASPKSQLQQMISPPVICKRSARTLWIVTGLLVGAGSGALVGICPVFLQLFFGALVGGMIGYLLHFRLSLGEHPQQVTPAVNTNN